MAEDEKKKEEEGIHASDCAVHNMPACPNEQCNCGAECQNKEEPKVEPVVDNENILISAMVSFKHKSEEDNSPKIVFTFYAGAARYMEIETDQIHLDAHMRNLLKKYLASG